MSNIGRVDQAVLQLRLQLQRIARGRAQGAAKPEKADPSPLRRLQSLGQPGDDADEGFRRNFVRALLTEELGETLANEVEFERISNEVWRLLDEDPDTRALMDQALGELGTGSS